ncbi:hypothetical protein [Persephonella sp.]
MAVEMSSGEFVNVLKVLISMGKRFNCPSRICTGYFQPEKKQLMEKLDDILVEVLRDTDMVFRVEDGFFIILPETDMEGAGFISRGIFEFFNGEVAEVMVCYPEDGKDINTVLQSLIDQGKNKYGFMLEKYLKR